MSQKGNGFAKAPIRRLMKAEGAELVSNDAVNNLIEELVKTATNITKLAVEITTSDKRKRVMASDVRAAIQRK